MAGKKRSSGRSGKGGRHGGGGSSQWLARLERALAEAARELYREGLGQGVDDEVRIPLELRALVSGGPTWRTAAEPSLKEQIAVAVREAGARAQIYRPGYVYCFRCESSGCEHSCAPAPTMVFGGYSPTGVPQWQEFAQVLIDAKHPRADLLFEAPARSMAAVFIGSDSLKARQLGVFGLRSKTYDILGQVVLGFLHLRPAGTGGTEREKAALTLQGVEIRYGNRRPRVVLNVLGKLSDGSEAMEALDGPFQMRVLDSVVMARRQIARIAPAAGRAKAAGQVDADRAARILRKTAGTLDRLGRQGARRTAHAQKRHVDRRPTAKALEDALGAREQNLLWDDRQQTVVVLAPRNRVHVYSPDGRHITSLVLTRDEIERRRRRKRWLTLDERRRHTFRKAFGRLTAGKPKQVSPR